MKKRFIIILVFAVIFLTIGGYYFFNQNKKLNQVNNPLNSEYTTEYVGEDTTIIHRNFRAIIKKDWQELEIPPFTYIYLPPGISSEDVNAVLISILITPLGENQLNLDYLLTQGIEESKEIISDFELIENTNWNNNYFVGKKIRFTGTSDNVKRDSLQIFGIKYNNLYVITYSCPIDNCNDYAIYNKLMETFEPVDF